MIIQIIEFEKKDFFLLSIFIIHFYFCISREQFIIIIHIYLVGISALLYVHADRIVLNVTLGIDTKKYVYRYSQLNCKPITMEFCLKNNSERYSGHFKCKWHIVNLSLHVTVSSSRSNRCIILNSIL